MAYEITTEIIDKHYQYKDKASHDWKPELKKQKNKQHIYISLITTFLMLLTRPSASSYVHIF